MTKRLISRGLAGACLLAMAASASAQGAWTPGSEIVGQSVQVETNGVVNTVYFDAGGQARIMTPGGNTIPASWTAGGGQLCLNTGAAQECWQYAQPFQAGQPISLTSSCRTNSRWLASATNTPPPPPPPEAAPERG